MKPKRADTKFNGVFFDDNYPRTPHRAWIKTGSQLVVLGRYATLREAVLVADFARYIVFGPDPSKWYNACRQRMSKPPTAAPVKSLPFDRQKILAKLLAKRCIEPGTMANHLQAYDKLASQLDKPAIT
jgi:hypothetical protein